MCMDWIVCSSSQPQKRCICTYTHTIAKLVQGFSVWPQEPISIRSLLRFCVVTTTVSIHRSNLCIYMRLPLLSTLWLIAIAQRIVDPDLYTYIFEVASLINPLIDRNCSTNCRSIDPIRIYLRLRLSSTLWLIGIAQRIADPLIRSAYIWGCASHQPSDWS
jgi:hypothetical protein